LKKKGRKMDDNFETKICSTIEEFTKLFVPRNSLREGRPVDFIFRGQGDADWSLTPRILRESTESQPSPVSMLLADPEVNVPSQLAMEKTILSTFIRPAGGRY
jgi:hypothetical protein